MIELAKKLSEVIGLVEKKQKELHGLVVNAERLINENRETNKVLEDKKINLVNREAKIAPIESALEVQVKNVGLIKQVEQDTEKLAQANRLFNEFRSSEMARIDNNRNSNKTETERLAKLKAQIDEDKELLKLERGQMKKKILEELNKKLG